MRSRQSLIDARRGLGLAALALVLLGSVVLFVERWHFIVDQPPIDFQLNWVAARRLVDREPLYDRAASRAEGARLIGPSMVPEFSSGATYSSYIGTPATALFYTPFAPFGAHRAATIYRAVQGALMVVAVVVTGFAMPRRSRWPAWIVGAVALLVFWPVQESIGLGQVDGLLMCSLAVALWAIARERWRTAGVALGVATLLKISPGLLLIYLALRGMTRVILPAVVTALSLVAVAMAVGRPGDLFTWIHDVAPKLSRGGLLVNNQSLAAWMARLFGHDLDWLSTNNDLGGWRVIAPIVVVAGIATLYLLCRRRPFVLLELGVVIFVALLAGPISWDHYPTWAILSLMLMADVALWLRRSRLEIGVLAVVLLGATALMHKGTQYYTPAMIRANWLRRVDAGSKTIALLAYLAVALWLLARRPNASGADASASERPHQRRFSDAKRQNGVGMNRGATR